MASKASVYPFQRIADELQVNFTDIARFIGCHRNMPAYVLAGKRDLNNDQVFYFGQLAVLTFNSKRDPNYAASRDKEGRKALKDELAATNKKLKIDLAKAQAQLAEMIKQYNATLNTLQKFEAMTGEGMDFEIELAQQNWINNMKSYWEGILSRCDVRQQHALNVRINAIRNEMAFNATVR